MARLLDEQEQPQMRRFWGGHQYLLNSRHTTKKEAHREAYRCRNDLRCLARVVKVGGYYYVYLGNARPKKGRK